jgi:hypothetical protein
MNMNKMQIPTLPHILHINMLSNSVSNLHSLCKLFSILVTLWNKIKLVYKLSCHEYVHDTLHYHEVQCSLNLMQPLYRIYIQIQ